VSPAIHDHSVALKELMSATDFASPKPWPHVESSSRTGTGGRRHSQPGRMSDIVCAKNEQASEVHKGKSEWLRARLRRSGQHYPTSPVI